MTLPLDFIKRESESHIEQMLGMPYGRQSLGISGPVTDKLELEW